MLLGKLENATFFELPPGIKAARRTKKITLKYWIPISQNSSWLYVIVGMREFSSFLNKIKKDLECFSLPFELN